MASASAGRLKGEAGDERTLGAKLARDTSGRKHPQGGSAIRVSAQLVDPRQGSSSGPRPTIVTCRHRVFLRRRTTSPPTSWQRSRTATECSCIRCGTRRAGRTTPISLPVEWQFQYLAHREADHALELCRAQEAGRERDESRGRAIGLVGLPRANLRRRIRVWLPRRRDLTDRALAAARRGVELDRANQFAMVALAQTHFFARTSRRLLLRPSGRWPSIHSTPTRLGSWDWRLAHGRIFERGTTIVRRAMELNANHAGWMHFAPLWDHFHKGEYEEALECANRWMCPDPSGLILSWRRPAGISAAHRSRRRSSRLVGA